MSSYFDDASLVMIPSGYKTSKVYSVKPTDGSGDLTFSRSNDTATRVNSAGLIEKVRTNQVLQSNTFSNASWTKTNATVTGGQAGYDGTTNAWLLSKSGSLGRVTQDVNTSGLKTFSLYAKAGTTNWIAITFTQAESFSYFNISNGTLGTNFGSDIVARTITSVGSGWYRVSISVNNTSSSVNVYVADSDGTVSGTSGNILIQAAQIEGGDIATNYIATTSAAVSVGPVANVPRLDYLNSSCPRLLLEPQRQNVITFSEQMDNAAWTKNNTSISANGATSPDGYTNADFLVENTANGLHEAYQILSVTSGVAYTLSTYAKADSRTKIALVLAGAAFIGSGGVGLAIFDLSAGSVVSVINGSTATITAAGNGWYRCTITKTSTDTGAVPVISLVDSSNNTSYTGNGTGKVALYGCQLEAGAYATSYIPTLGAAVTRGADVASKTSATALIGQTEGTVFVDWQIDSMPSIGSYFTFLLTQSIGTFSDIMYVAAYADGRVQASVFVGNVLQCNLISSTGFITAGANKFAFGYKANDFVLYANGTQVATDTSGSVPAATSIDLADTSGGKMNYKQALLFKTRLSNADLAALTA